MTSEPAQSAHVIEKACQLPGELAGASLQARVDDLIYGQEQTSTFGSGRATVHLCRLTEPGTWPVLLHVVADGVDNSAVEPRALTLEVHQPGAAKANGPIEIHRAHWCDCDLRGADLSGIQCYHVELERCRLDKVNMAHSHWTGCKWEGSDITHSNLTDCRLSGCQISNVGLRNCDLQTSRWSACTLKKVHWDASDFSGGALDSCALIEWQCKQVAGKGASARNCMLVAGCTLPDGFAPPRGMDRRTDLIRPGSTVLVPEFAPSYMNSLCDELGRWGVRHMVVRGGEGWLRDVLIKEASTSEGAPYRVMTAPSDPEQLYHGSASQYAHVHHSKFAPDKVPLATDGVSMEARHLPQVRLQTPDGDALPNVAFQATQRHFVPGGNLMWVDNDTVLVGNDSLRYDAAEDADVTDQDPQQAAKLAQQFPGIDDPQRRRQLKAGRTATKREFTDSLGAKNIIVLPQWAWHIDMGMAMVAERTLIVHSFDKSGDFLREHAADLQAALGMEKWQELVVASSRLKARFEHQVNKACDKLERAGFRVIKACCMLIEDVSPRGAPVGVHSLFSNGLTIQHGDSEQVSSTYLTPGTLNLKVHEDHFKEVVDSVGVQAKFLMGEDGADPLSDINRRQGAARCMTFSDAVTEYSHFPD